MYPRLAFPFGHVCILGMGAFHITWTSFKETYPVKTSRVHRRVWTVPAFDIGIQSQYNDKDHDWPTAVYMTYQIAAEKLENDIGVQILQVCQQIYVEASKILYGRNSFSFTSDFRIPCAFAFLCDRPAASLLMITSLELALTEGNNMRGTSQAHYPVIRRSTDCLVLNYAYQYFTELCTLLSTPRVQLCELYLTIETIAQRSPASPTSLAELSSLENDRMTMPRPWAALWLDPLLKINGLKFVQTCWISGQPCIQRMADMVGTIRRYMLFGKESSDSIDQAIQSEEEISTLGFRMMFHKDGGRDLIEDSWSGWREFALENDGLREVEGPDCDEQLRAERPLIRPHLGETLEAYAQANVCYYELKSA